MLYTCMMLRVLLPGDRVLRITIWPVRGGSCDDGGACPNG